jgi:hypothetical protein
MDAPADERQAPLLPGGLVAPGGQVPGRRPQQLHCQGLQGQLSRRRILLQLSGEEVV